MRPLSRIAAIFFKELAQLRRDRMTFGMVIMIPLIQLILFGYAINTNIRDIPIAVVDQDQTAISRILIQMVEATRVVEVTERYTSVEEAEAAIKSARVRAAFILPDDLSQRIVRSPATGFGTPPSTDEETSRPVAQWIVDGSDTMIAGAIKGLRNMPLAELFRKAPNRSTPTFEVALFFNPEQRTAVNIVPGLVGIILTMTMIMFTSAAIVRERERGNMEMLINTPVRPMELMIGKIIPYIFIGLLQTAIILGLGYLLFNVPLGFRPFDLLAGTLLFIGASLSLGLVLSTIAQTQLQATQMTVFLLVPSILLSGFMFPYEGMPVIAQYIAEALPATHFMRMVRGFVLRDAGLLDMYRDVLWMCGFFVLGLAVAAFRFKKRLD
ncbi:ABC transporter permease [Roseibium marinum]|uniref:Transport permease protein n=1 Tax=Roseibium marinum TaxID=281252 RepID=A0A2S3UXD0_9HYPH|nr:ABC transporter permease [Roseibium marinum]POF32240.1 ABC-2 type transport system permease protein [Roseibium marinum]